MFKDYQAFSSNILPSGPTQIKVELLRFRQGREEEGAFSPIDQLKYRPCHLQLRRLWISYWASQVQPPHLQIPVSIVRIKWDNVCESIGIYEILRKGWLSFFAAAASSSSSSSSFLKYGGKPNGFQVPLRTYYYSQLFYGCGYTILLHPSFCLCVSICVSMYPSTYLPVIFL